MRGESPKPGATRLPVLTKISAMTSSIKQYKKRMEEILFDPENFDALQEHISVNGERWSKDTYLWESTNIHNKKITPFTEEDVMKVMALKIGDEIELYGETIVGISTG